MIFRAGQLPGPRLLWRSLALGLVLAGMSGSVLAQRPDDDGPNIATAEYRERQAKVAEALGDGLVVLLGARAEEFGEFVKFRQKNDVMYLSGVGQPGAALVLVPAKLSPDGQLRSLLFLPPRNAGR